MAIHYNYNGNRNVILVKHNLYFMHDLLFNLHKAPDLVRFIVTFKPHP